MRPDLLDRLAERLPRSKEIIIVLGVSHHTHRAPYSVTTYCLTRITAAFAVLYPTYT